MKSTIKIFFGLFISLLLLSQAGFAQKRGVTNLPKYDLEAYHFGFILAVNQMLFTTKPVAGHQFVEWPPLTAEDLTNPTTDHLQLYEVYGTPTPGFTIGIVGNLRLGNHFDLRFIPSLAFGERHLDYTTLVVDNDPLLTETISNRKTIASTFVDFPLYIKFRSARDNNVSAYLIGGAKYSLDLASNKKNQAINVVPIRLNQHDIAAEIGVGFDFYTVYFKFGVEAKMSYGLFDILIKDGSMYSDGLAHIHNKIFQLSFTFE